MGVRSGAKYQYLLAAYRKKERMQSVIMMTCWYLVFLHRSTVTCMIRMAGRYHSGPLSGSQKAFSCSKSRAPKIGFMAESGSGSPPLSK